MGRKITLVLSIVLSVLLVLASMVACNNKPQEEQHVFGDDWQYDDASHWKNCTIEGHADVSEKQAHVFVDGARKTCSVCGKTVEYTNEDNAAYWLAGRDFSNAYDGEFTTKYNYDYVYSDTESEHHEKIESLQGKYKYYYQEKDTYVDGEDVDEQQATIVTEQAKVENVDCVTAIVIRQQDEEIHKEASYYSADYVEEYIECSPSMVLLNNFCTDGNNEAEIKSDLSTEFNESATVVFSKFLFVRNDDGSVSLLVEGTREDTFEGNEGEEILSKLAFKYEVKVKDGKVVYLRYDEDRKDYKGETLDYSLQSTDVFELSYEFAKELYDSVDKTTDTVANRLMASVDIFIDGFDTDGFTAYGIVGEEMSLHEVYTEVFDSRGFWVGDVSDKATIDYYFDAEKTQPVPDYFVPKDEHMNIYVFITPDESTAIVYAVFEKIGSITNEPYRYANVAYVVNSGERFYPRAVFENYPIISVNGQPAPEYTSFVCEGGNVYNAVYNAHSETAPEIVHKGIPEWTTTEYYHWHECDACGKEQKDWGMHVFEEVDGKQICKTCGYEQKEDEGSSASLYAMENENFSALKQQIECIGVDKYCYENKEKFVKQFVEAHFERKFLHCESLVAINCKIPVKLLNVMEG